MPELPEVETERGRLAEAIAGRRIISARIDDARLTRPYDPLAVAAQLTGDLVDTVERRGKYMVVRLASGRVSSRPPPDDRRLPVRRRRRIETCCARARRRRAESPIATRAGSGRGFSRTPSDADRLIAVKNGPEPLARRFTIAFLAGRLARRTAPLKAAHPRSADGRRAREHLRRRGALALPSPPAASGRRAHAQRGRCTARGNPQGAAARDSARRRNALRPGVRRRRDAARVPRLRPRRRAVRPLRRADRENRRRRARNVVLPAVPAGGSRPLLSLD